MQLTDTGVFNKAKTAYELSRLKLGLGTSAFVSVLPLLSLALGGQISAASALGTLLVFTVGVLVWRGGLLSLSAMSGLKAGLFPLVLSHAANLYGHVCIPGRGCSSLCIPACSVGGLVAGFLIERVAFSASRPWLIRLVGATVGFLTGALGCACVGSAGLIGLVAGMAVTLGVGQLSPRRGT